MKRTTLAALAAIATLQISTAGAVEIEGFRFDDALRLGNAELVVNGTGVRSKFGKRYAMALYLPAKSADPKAILAAKGPKRIAISLIKDVDGDTFAGAVSKGINNNSSDAEKAVLKERVKQLADTVVALGEIKAGSSIVFDWLPEKGTVLTINGQPRGREIAGEDFYAALLKVWLGDDPVQNDLKQGLLGKAS
ncbi:chalcone isomerase family protein [Azospira restricta]|uniref:Chalcone isomerase family protein n=1 Tax=Azospira restricta TaxID=404405 RepID=A0A974SP59_9RHOO|nr:chalcone isomerase family protein [Azospira restricta]QRJ63893.1 chalcone isomerase family protein [Azospira restricta]